MKEMLKANLKEANKLNEKGSGLFTRSELMDIENELERMGNRNIMIKGSRFTLGEKLQFTKVNNFFIVQVFAKRIFDLCSVLIGRRK